jgi:hypothetical protein
MANLTMPTFMTKWYVTFVFMFQVSPPPPPPSATLPLHCLLLVLTLSHSADCRDLILDLHCESSKYALCCCGALRLHIESHAGLS